MMKRNALNTLGFEVPILRADTSTSSSRTYPTKTITNGSETLLLNTLPHETVTVGSPNTPGGPVVVDISGADPSRCLIYHIYPDKSNILQLQDLIVGIVHGNNPRNNKTSPSSPVNLSFPAPILPHCVSCMRLRDNGWQDKYCFKFVLITADGFLHMITLIQGQDILQQLNQVEQDVVLSVDLRPWFQKSCAQPTCLTQAGTFICIGTDHGTLLTVPMKRDRFKNASASSVIELHCGGSMSGGGGLGAMFGGLISRASHAVSSSITIPTGNSTHSCGKSMTKGIRHLLELQLATSEDLFFVCAIDESSHMYLWQLDNKTMVYDAALLPEEEAKLYRPAFARLAAEPLDATTILLLLCFEPMRYGSTGVTISIDTNGDTVARAPVSQFQARSYELILEDRGPNVYKAQVQSGTQLVAPSVHRALDVMLEHVSSQCVGVWLLHYDSLGARKLTCIPMVFGDAEAIPTETRLIGDQIRDALPGSRDQMNVVQEVWGAMKPALDKASSMIDSSLSVVGEAVMDVMLGPGRVCRGALATALYMTLEKERVVVADGAAGISLDIDADEQRRNEYRQSCASADVVQLRRVIRKKVTAYCQSNNINEVESIECWCELAQNYAGAWSDGSNAPVALIQHPPASSSANMLQAGSASTTFLHAFYVARANGAVSFIRQAQATELPGVNQGMVLLKIPVEWVEKQQTRISQLFLPILEAMNLVSEAAGGALLMRMLWMSAQRGCNIGNVVLPAAVKALIAGNTAAATSGGADRDARNSSRDACLGAWRGRCRLLPLKLGELMAEIDSANNNGNLAQAIQIALDVLTFELRVPSKRQPACHPTTLTAAAAIETMACQITECQLQVVTQLLLLSKYVLWSGHLGTRNHTTAVCNNNSGGAGQQQQQQQLWTLSNEVRKEMAYVMIPKTINVFIAVASAQWACVRPLDSIAMASLSLKQRINFNTTITGSGGGVMNAAGAALGRIDPSRLVVHSSTSEIHNGGEDAAIKRARLGGGGGGGGLSSSSTATVIQQDLYTLSLLFFGPSPPSSLQQQQQQGEGQQQLPPSAREYHVDSDGCLLIHSIRNLSDVESAAIVFTQRLVGMTRALSLDLRSEEQPLSYSQPVSLAALPLAGQLLQHQVAPSLRSLINSYPPSNHPTGPTTTASDLSLYDADADGGVSGLSRLVALGKDSMMTEDLHLLFFDACVELHRAVQKSRSSFGAAGGKKKKKKDIGKSTGDLLDNSMAKFFHVANIYGSADQKDIAFLVRMLQKLATTTTSAAASDGVSSGVGGTISLPSTPRNVGELLQQTVLFYYETLTRVYRHIGAPRHAIKCAFAALQSANSIIADPNNCKHYCSQLWRAVFSASLACHDYEQAYVAMQAVTVPELKVDCLQRLVNILCSAPTSKTKVIMLTDGDGDGKKEQGSDSRLELLVRLPYAESILVNREGRQMWVPLIEEVTHMLWRRAETLDVKAHPQPCKVLFAFFTARGDHQSAARAMLTYARRLMAELATNNTTAAAGGIFATAPIGSKKRGGTTFNNANKTAAIAAAYLDTLRAVHAALTVAAASLSLVDPSRAWLEDPYFNFPTTIDHTIMSGSTTMMMMDGAVVTVEDLNKEVAVAKARCTVADTLSEREQQQGTTAAVVSMISSLDTPEDIFQHLLSLNLHDEAVSLAVAVFEGTRQVRACERSVSSLATHCVRLQQQQQQQAASLTADGYSDKDNGDGGDNDTMMAVEYSDGRMRTVSPPPTSYLSASSSMHVDRNRGGASSPSFTPSAIPPPPPQYHHHRKSFDTDRQTTTAAKVVVTPAQARRAWQLLRRHIERLESLSSSFIRLRLIAIESILATEPSFGIFQWLLAPFISRGTTRTTDTGTAPTTTKAMMMADVGGLVRVLMRFGRLEEAADIVIRHLEDVLVRSVPSITMKHTAAIYYPHRLLEQLMRELEEEERRGGGDGGASESQRYAAERLRKLVEEEREAAMRQTDVISRVYG
jgi:hypothetical protein